MSARVSTRSFLAALLLISLLLAGFVSYYASSHPDGLESVAERTGFASSATDHATAESPLADYQTKGISSARLSGGVAGIVGALVVAGLGGGLFWVIRRRPVDAGVDHA